MAGKKKIMKKLDISVRSEQYSIQRYANMPSFQRDSDEQIPEFRAWRNNLAALSQRYNYLFLACRSEVLVYIPEYPTQNISPICILKFELPRSGEGARGHLDPRDPHAINHMIIGDIGNHEILLASCDDGDVAAISTRLIHRAAQRNVALARGEHGPPAEDIRAFFSGNVGASAWGLAIHKEARLFAVSANTHAISIFAFALGNVSSEDGTSSSEEDDLDEDMEDLTDNADWNDLEGPPYPGQRASQNLHIVLSGHLKNIPNIAFCNTDGDLEGKYLVSTDIEDRNLVWDIWQQEEVYSFSFMESHNTSSSFFTGPYSERRGWGVACLDPLSFRLTETRSQTFGCRILVRRMTYSDEWDITASTEHVSNSSTYHPAMSELSAGPGLPNIRTHAYQNLSQFNNDEESEDEETYPEDGEDDERDQVPDGKGFKITWANKEQQLPFHILHTSEHDIGMFLVEDNTRVLCEHALQQRCPPRLDDLLAFDRMNMIQQIPELGVVAVASNIGRVALLTTTRMKNTPISGFRIDWILPFKSQEEKGLRPEMPLVGIAVSPVQGQGNPGEIADEDVHGPDTGRRSSRLEPRRYRIMLIYIEHTVLSYEIGRSTVGAGFEVNDRTILL